MPEKAQPAAPERKLHEQAGLSADQETALLAIEQAMSELRAHADDLSQWRLLQVERALDALDKGLHRTALELVERAVLPAAQVPESERAEAARLARRLEVAQLLARLHERQARGS
jgi:hypothetical protein